MVPFWFPQSYGSPSLLSWWSRWTIMMHPQSISATHTGFRVIQTQPRLIVYSKRECGSLVRLWWSASLNNSAYSPHNDNEISRWRSNLPSAKQVLGTFQPCISLHLIIITARPRELCLNWRFITLSTQSLEFFSVVIGDQKLCAVTARTARH